MGRRGEVLIKKVIWEVVPEKGIFYRHRSWEIVSHSKKYPGGRKEKGERAVWGGRNRQGDRVRGRNQNVILGGGALIQLQKMRRERSNARRRFEKNKEKKGGILEIKKQGGDGESTGLG